VASQEEVEISAYQTLLFYIESLKKWTKTFDNLSIPDLSAQEVILSITNRLSQDESLVEEMIEKLKSA